MAKPYKRKDSPYWWIRPTVDGIQQPQSTKTTDYQEALDQLRRLEGKIVDGLITATTQSVTFGDLCDLLERDYRTHQRHSLVHLQCRLERHIRPALGALRASSISTVTISAYIERRQEANASAATINRELAVIRRAYALGRRSGAILTAPFIDLLPEDNVRQGFFNEDHFRAVLRVANPLLKDVLIVAYYTGWRLQSILTLEWSSIDERDQVIRWKLRKNRKPVTFPLAPFPELAEAIARRKAATKGLITPWVFHRDGACVKSIQTAWEIARRKANVPGRLLHDFRRTAVRNLKRGGWSDTEIMNMVGLKTLSMLIRYSITTEDDILRKAALIAHKAPPVEQA